MTLMAFWMPTPVTEARSDSLRWIFWAVKPFMSVSITTWLSVRMAPRP